MTILHWLNLFDTDVLELERGEDIDEVYRDILDEESHGTWSNSNLESQI